jgi:tetratricopeptide (TPR) repeat protein
MCMRRLIWLLSLVLACAAAQVVDPAELAKQARKLSADGQQDKALALYRRAISRAPELFDAHLGIGVVLDLNGSYKEARQHFAKAIEKAPDQAGRDQALAAMGVSYAFDGDAKQSAAFYRQLFDRQTTASDLAGAAATANALGRVYLEANDLDNAAQWYQTGYETSRRQAKLPSDQADLWDLRWAHAQARIAARKGHAAEAHTQMALVQQLLAKGTNPEQQIQYPYLAGYVALYLKDYRGAVAALTQADQKDPFILVLLAQAYEKLQDAANARQCYTEALASNAHSLNNAFARPLARKKLGR